MSEESNAYAASAPPTTIYKLIQVGEELRALLFIDQYTGYIDIGSESDFTALFAQVPERRFK